MTEDVSMPGIKPGSLKGKCWQILFYYQKYLLQIKIEYIYKFYISCKNKAISKKKI